MHFTLNNSGFSLGSPADSVHLAAARPCVHVGLAGYRHVWKPTSFQISGNHLAAHNGPGGLALDLDFIAHDDCIEVRGRLTNRGTHGLRLDRFELLHCEQVRVGNDPRRWRMYRNGYQSWAGTFTLGREQSDRDFPFRVARVGVTDAKHRAPRAAGHLRSDGLSAIADPQAQAALGIGFTTLDVAFCFVEIEAGSSKPTLRCWADFDGITLQPGETTAEIALVLVSATDHPDAGWHALRRVAELSGQAMQARGVAAPHPTGWCSWYYYFEKVTERDIDDNLAVLAADGRAGSRFGCEYIMVDDGHQSQIGDWLQTAPAKFPSGMRAVAAKIHTAGFDAGIWWAPFFVASTSKVALAHPEWLVRNQRGRPITGLINPAWGLTTPMRVLDTTHPAVLEHLESVAHTIGHDWGYEIQKLDFLYAAALPGLRYDRNATRAQSLRRGLEAVRRGAGEAAFLLGCGCPLGPAVGVVDAMRIGADVTPYWSNWLARRVLLDVHGLATRHAVLNTLTRAVLDRTWWLNDPDCLMVRDSDTRLTEEEVRTMATVFAMTDGMLVLSDRLDRLPPSRLELLQKARHLAGGRVEVCDLFDAPLPSHIISRHADRIDVAVLNLGDTPRDMTFDLRQLGEVPKDGRRGEYWTEAAVEIRAGHANFGLVPPHAARVLSFALPEVLSFDIQVPRLRGPRWEFRL